MEINGINTASSASEMHSSNSVRADKGHPNIDFYDEIDTDNMQRRQISRENVQEGLKELKDNIEVHDNWYHVFVGEDYLKLKGDGKLTFKELRNKLGIPPTALSKTNGKKFNDDDVIKDSVEINFSDIGWFERRMDEMEARDAVAQRNRGNYVAGYSRSISDKDIFEALGK